ncbi:hypothetical protein [Sphingobacterium sp.]|uniref:hypothetical protein n=1 Tax=Sphingobacterium sp. TaxID=341027 RepID=UPI0031DB6F0D
MVTRFNFQINPYGRRKAWDQVPVKIKFLANWAEATSLAKRASKIFKAEVRLTEGIKPLNKSGAYFYYLD